MTTWSPTPEMVRAAERCFLAKAIHAQRSAIADPIRRAVLKQMAPKPNPVYTRCAPSIPEQPISDPAHAWLMAEGEFRAYIEECERRERVAGLVPDKPGNCPVLEAEHCLRVSENALIDTVGATLPTPLNSARLHGELRQKAVDLCLRLLAPFVRDSGQILDTLLPAARRSGPSGPCPTPP